MVEKSPIKTKTPYLISFKVILLISIPNHFLRNCVTFCKVEDENDINEATALISQRTSNEMNMMLRLSTRLKRLSVLDRETFLDFQLSELEIILWS